MKSSVRSKTTLSYQSLQSICIDGAHNPKELMISKPTRWFDLPEAYDRLAVHIPYAWAKHFTERSEPPVRRSNFENHNASPALIRDPEEQEVSWNYRREGQGKTVITCRRPHSTRSALNLSAHDSRFKKSDISQTRNHSRRSDVAKRIVFYNAHPLLITWRCLVR